MRIESAAGEMIAAPRPCTPRAPISEASLQARPASSEPTREDGEAGDEHAAAPEQVGRAAAEQQEAAEDERVGADHPLQVLLREPEVGLDRGQRDVHDRDVEDDHELHDAEEGECPPFARCRRDHVGTPFESVFRRIHATKGGVGAEDDLGRS